jgi:hypothetical protein
MSMPRRALSRGVQIISQGKTNRQQESSSVFLQNPRAEKMRSNNKTPA